MTDNRDTKWNFDFFSMVKSSNKHYYYVLVMVVIIAFTACDYNHPSDSSLTENGVSMELATRRKEILSDISYQLSMGIPKQKEKAIVGKETITFNLSTTRDTLILDFKADPKQITVMSVNAQPIRTIFRNEHILIPPAYLKKGKNTFNIHFNVGDAALNRRQDYLYTLFVPDRARTAFPCFDQPDLKAVFKLTLAVPKDWMAISNGILKDSSMYQDFKLLNFAPSDKISTYLFSFVAGKFKAASDYFNGKRITLLYRETDQAKIQASMDSIFKCYKESIAYYEKWTGIPYPFQKMGMVAIPDFQFGGMEHPGAILFQNSALFLDKSATEDQINSRSNVIAHEVAHMWFGDMVTMQWFSDVWMKEVFANFMADKSTGSLINKQDYELKFLTTHYPLAYNTDRTTGSNPIRQNLDNLQNAGMLYGNIIYQKAPIMMRQLELLMGTENFKLGVQQYLKKYAYGNASWPDLISILSKYTKRDLINWNKVWVNEVGRPVFDYGMQSEKGIIKRFVLNQRAENVDHIENGKTIGNDGNVKNNKKNKDKDHTDLSDKLWPQVFDIAFYYKDSIKSFRIVSDRPEESIKTFEEMPVPKFILINSSGIGYGVFPIDTAALSHVSTINNPISRSSLYISLFENVMDSKCMDPLSLLKFYTHALHSEKTELSVKLLTEYINTLYWSFLTPQTRISFAPVLESTLQALIKKAPTSNEKKLLFLCLQNTFLTKDAYNLLYQIWQTQKSPIGIQLSPDDFTNLAYAIALRNNSNSSILQTQLARIKDPDRVNRFKIIMPALSSDENIRDAFFKGLDSASNRKNESAVSTALYYLNHPLRQNTSIRYLKKSLEMLETIQITGDIFFPGNWLQSTTGSYQGKQALDMVNSFLNTHPGLNPVLKNKVLQASDNLRRGLVLMNQISQ